MDILVPKEVLEDLLDIAVEYVSAVGGCDHSTGICVCGVQRVIEEAEQYLRK